MRALISTSPGTPSSASNPTTRGGCSSPAATRAPVRYALPLGRRGGLPDSADADAAARDDVRDVAVPA
ncbi:hypothetical protein [Streptomyces sp. DSM 15324]|uniref:hypothetical protein n=1 Tax=Streptomyces sp. DSM 15324 TaxID=1739111 RepID=UPI00074B29AB|nr:hypothetical protein [Streptomyces sp. DSM 15324]KUO11067.1 hypothetical protein AQJ58_16100 [Streptomyces sp. DSM 15324]